MSEGLDVAHVDGLLAGVLPAGSLYAVGGRVRDEVRSALDGVERPAKDLDYVAVGVELDSLIERLGRVGRADVVGASFSVVKCTIEDVTVDVALPRRERSTGSGHRDFTVESGPGVALTEDLARRDFRMNMLARALPEGELVDPYGGVGDIVHRRIDLLRAEAFIEDPLRMLRACQFAARFEYTLSPGTLAAMRQAAPLVETVSADRVHDELLKLLVTAVVPSRGLEAMRAGEILGFVLPEIAEGIGVGQNAYHAYDVYGHALATLDATPPGDAVLRLAALFHDVGKPRSKTIEDGEAHFYRHELIGEVLTREALGRLRFSNEDTAAVARLVLHHMYAADPAQEDKTVRRFVRRIGTDLIEHQFALRQADIEGSGLPRRGDNNERFEERVRGILAARPALGVRDLAIGGSEVIDLLVAAGKLPAGSRGSPHVGRVLSELLDLVLDAPESNTEPSLRRAAASIITRP